VTSQREENCEQPGATRNRFAGNRESARRRTEGARTTEGRDPTRSTSASPRRSKRSNNAGRCARGDTDFCRGPIRAAQRAAGLEEVSNRLKRWRASWSHSSRLARGACALGKSAGWSRAGRHGGRRPAGENQKDRTRISEVRTDRDVKRDSLAQARLELAERRQKVECSTAASAKWKNAATNSASCSCAANGNRGLDRADRRTRARRGRTTVPRRKNYRDFDGGDGQVEKVRSELAALEREITALRGRAGSIRHESDKAHRRAQQARDQTRRRPPAGAVPRRGSDARIPGRHRRARLETPPVARRRRAGRPQATRPRRGG